ncbi:MAG: transpeptidase family protein [Paludibacteraceae bacterium]|nr:transpeptidase family protein [Paludibacteraceae bacterium]
MSVKKGILVRFFIVYALAFLMAFCIVGSAVMTIARDGERWRQVGSTYKRDSLEISPNRGNILACDGKLLASTIPSYTLYMDFRADGMVKDTLYKYIDSLSICLSRVYTDKSPAELKNHILKGFKSQSRWYKVNNKKLTYNEKKEVQQFPFFRMGPNKSGYAFYEQVSRKKPLGSLASRTIGDIYAESDKGGSCGLEMKYDSYLRGKSGVITKQKIAGRFRSINLIDPEDGFDVKTTIDVNIQDITESALLAKLMEVEADRGCAVVMETQSGEVKAISNLQRREDGRYVERQNFAVSSETEPGSTFKVASVMVALEDGVVDTSYKVDTENGIWNYKGVNVKDHNWNKGGYHVISLNQAIAYSSNIGVAKVIDNYYGNNPSRFVDRLYEMKLNEPMDLEIPGAGKPKIKYTSSPNWSGTSLAWMSFGYETQIPPIYMLTFYNAIANNGRMIKPYFVKSICKDGVEKKKFSTSVINHAICSQKTLAKVKDMLVGVVEFGTARNVKSEHFKIAGKTGTAQVDYGKRGVRKSHQLTFCGFFPADDPKYSMIVVVWSPKKGYPSAGAISGSVFKTIAERVYAQSPLIHTDPFSSDEDNCKIPITKDGDVASLKLVMDNLKIPYVDQDANKKHPCQWVFSEAQSKEVLLKPHKVSGNYMPDVRGMGAKDAIFLLENKGLRVSLSGKGRVAAQSKNPGDRIESNETVVIELK